MDEKQVPLEAALVHDALQVYHKSLELYGINHKKFSTVKHDCKDWKRSSSSKSKFGYEFAKFMKLQEFENGATGKIQFKTVDKQKGTRTEFKLEILEMTKPRFKREFSKIGSWDITNGVKYDRDTEDVEAQIAEAIEQKTFKIVVKLGQPFLMEKIVEGDVQLEGNARYEGYVVDLINRIKQLLKFKNYELEVVPDGEYGSLNPTTKKWNGLVKHLLDRKADLAIADLTMTYERKTAVDFTMPFMSLGIGILYTKPPEKPTDLFKFLQPFTIDVWLYTGLAYLSVSVLIFILSRINNDDWESGHPCNQEPEEVESIWNILNCVWLAMGSIMGQGCDILPK